MMPTIDDQLDRLGKRLVVGQRTMSVSLTACGNGSKKLIRQGRRLQRPASLVARPDGSTNVGRHRGDQCSRKVTKHVLSRRRHDRVPHRRRPYEGHTTATAYPCRPALRFSITSWAALWPGAPMTQPPGQAPEPQMGNLRTSDRSCWDRPQCVTRDDNMFAAHTTNRTKTHTTLSPEQA